MALFEPVAVITDSPLVSELQAHRPALQALRVWSVGPLGFRVVGGVRGRLHSGLRALCLSCCLCSWSRGCCGLWDPGRHVPVSSV